jgi:hypothetical protein
VEGELMTLRVWARVCSLACVLATLVVPGPGVAAAENAQTSWLPGVRASEVIDGPVLAAGRLLGPKGLATSGRVMAVAWPRMSVLAAAKNGDSVKTATVGKATAGPDGHFVLRVDPRAPIGEFMESDGTVNFDVYAFAGDTSTVTSFGRRFEPSVKDAWVDPNWQPAFARSRPREFTMALSRANGGNASTTTSPAEPTAPPPPANKDFGCPNTVVDTYNQVTTVIGEVYPGPHATADFQYLQQSKSTLGIGVSGTGTQGSFTVNGEVSITSTGTIDYATQGHNAPRIWETSFQYKLFHVQTFTEFGCIYWDYESRPTAWQGAALGYTPCCLPTTNNCSIVQIFPGQTVTLTKKTAKAVTFSDSVKLGSIIGINLSGSTGFDTSTKIAYKFNVAGGLLCGEGVAWPDAARIRAI